MIFTLKLLLIVALILLTLKVIGVLQRLVILIVMARSLRWSKLTQSLTSLTIQTDSDLEFQDYAEKSESPFITTKEEWKELMGPMRIQQLSRETYSPPQVFDDEDARELIAAGSSGIVPSGVSFMSADDYAIPQHVVNRMNSSKPSRFQKLKKWVKR